MEAVIRKIRGPDGLERPYFMWDRAVTDEMLRAAIADPDHPHHVDYMRVLLREALPGEVWTYVTPETVVAEWDSIRPGLGRRRAFWEWLLNAWRERGYLK